MNDMCVGDYGGCSNQVPCSYCVKSKKNIGDVIIKRLEEYKEQLKHFGYTPESLQQEINTVKVSECKSLDELMIAKVDQSK